MRFKKILVSEDADSNNLGIVTQVVQLGDVDIDQSQSCDVSLLKIKSAILNKTPFELLITDLSFEHDVNGKIKSGVELIIEVKKLTAQIKIVVFSQYDDQLTIKKLMHEQKIDGYVCKGINGLKELKKAIAAVGLNKTYTCPVATASLRKQGVLQLNNFQKQLLKLLAEGNKHNQIHEIFLSKNIQPNSIRSIETNISKLKDAFNAANTTQLVYLASNSGLI